MTATAREMWRRAAIAGLVLFLVSMVPGPMGDLRAEQPPVPRLTQYVTDQTGSLSWEQIAQLNSKLEQFEKTTSTQIVVLLVPTLGDYAVEEYALKVAELNKIGREGKDNGALLLIAKNERRVRIEVGYGLEGALPDILSGQIVRKEIGPRFAAGDFYGGIDAGVEAMMKATRNEYTADPESSGRSVRSILPMLVILFVFFMIMSRMVRSRRRFLRSGSPFGGPGGFPPIGGGWGGGRTGGWGGGSFGGGSGGGGFSGGGGSFGGGGASGSW